MSMTKRQAYDEAVKLYGKKASVEFFPEKEVTNRKTGKKTLRKQKFHIGEVDSMGFLGGVFFICAESEISWEDAIDKAKIAKKEADEYQKSKRK